MHTGKRARLSPRELDIIYKAADGQTDKEIASALGIAEGSIKTHWQRLRVKMDLSSRTAAVAHILAEDHARLIEELRASELRAGYAIEALEDVAVFMMDGDGAILTWNPGVQHVLGFEENEFVGQQFGITFTEADREAQRPKNELAQARLHGRYREEQWHAKKGSEGFYAIGSLFAIRDARGEVEFFLKIMQDRTHEKQLELDFHQLHQRYDELLKKFDELMESRR